MKIFWRVLLGIVIFFLLLGLLTSKHHVISKEIVIAAPRDLVYDQINDLNKWNTWSPWEQKDATIKKTFGPSSIGKGSFYTWTSKKSGNGKMTITDNTPDTISTAIEFEGMGTAKSQYAFSREDRNTKVVWSFVYETPFPWNAITWLMGGERSVGKDFESGLASLKKVCEQLKSVLDRKYRGFYVKMADIPTTLYAFKRATVEIKGIGPFLGSSYGELSKVIADQQVKVTGPASAFYWTFDLTAGKTDMAAALPVDKTISGNTQMSSIELGGKAVIVDYYGDYSKLGEAHNGIGDYMKEKSLKNRVPVVELYYTDPTTEKDTAKWFTKIIYFIE